MSVFKCKMCGGTVEFEQGATVGVCDSCGTKQTLPRLDDEKRANLYDRANHFRRNNEYDKAAGIYEQILSEDSADAEAYWSLVLCRYGIEYVEDPATHKRIPTVNRTQYTSIFADEDYKSALEHADGYQREIYEQEARAIDEIQRGILAISQKEEPFDVFICYKETDNSGRRTPDSVLANDLYHQLAQEGFKVFFARITLEDKLGSAYEPYIFAALNSSKVMVVLGTKPEYFNAVWVKNEWSRYLALIKNGAKKMLIPAYRDMDPYDLPEEFSHLQAQDMSKLGFMQDLIRGIKKIVDANTLNSNNKNLESLIYNNTNSELSSYLKRVFLFLEDGNWQEAKKYCEKVLDIDPECAKAYLGKFMADIKVKTLRDLSKYNKAYSKNENYLKTIRFADSELIDYLNNTLQKKEPKPSKEKPARKPLLKKPIHKKLIVIVPITCVFLALIIVLCTVILPSKKNEEINNTDNNPATTPAIEQQEDDYISYKKDYLEIINKELNGRLISTKLIDFNDDGIDELVTFEIDEQDEDSHCYSIYSRVDNRAKLVFTRTMKISRNFDGYPQIVSAIANAKYPYYLFHDDTYFELSDGEFIKTNSAIAYYDKDSGSELYQPTSYLYNSEIIARTSGGSTDEDDYLYYWHNNQVSLEVFEQFLRDENITVFGRFPTYVDNVYTNSENALMVIKELSSQLKLNYNYIMEYKKIVLNLEQKNGKKVRYIWGSHSLEDGSPVFRGVCRVDLIDLNDDYIEELLVEYIDKDLGKSFLKIYATNENCVSEISSFDIKDLDDNSVAITRGSSWFEESDNNKYIYITESMTFYMLIGKDIVEYRKIKEINESATYGYAVTYINLSDDTEVTFDNQSPYGYMISDSTGCYFYKEPTHNDWYNENVDGALKFTPYWGYYD